MNVRTIAKRLRRWTRTSPLGVGLLAPAHALLRNWDRAIRQRPDHVPHRWLTPVPDCAGREICLFVTYAPGPRVAAQAVFHARAWHQQGVPMVLIVCLDDPDGFDEDQDLSFCDAVLLRANRGYDFGAWAAAIRMLPSLADARGLILVNDSIYGPFRRFPAMVERLRGSPADLCGLVNSTQFAPHIQSFLLRFGPGALAHHAFWSFWRKMRVGDRRFVIRTGELALARRMREAGLTTEVLYPLTDDAPNPTLGPWRALIEVGFPYIKAQLLRDNPYRVDIDDWRGVMRREGYDPALVDEHRRDRAPDPR